MVYDEEKDNPKNYYKSIYQTAWNQWEYRSRSRDRVEKKLEILLAVSGVLAAILLSNSTLFQSNYFVWISVALLGTIFLISLYEFIIPRKDPKQLFWFPSVEAKERREYKKNRDIDGFYKQIVEECYKLEGNVNDYVARRAKLIIALVFMLLFAVYVPIAYEIYTNYYFLFSGSLVAFAVVLVVFYRASK